MPRSHTAAPTTTPFLLLAPARPALFGPDTLYRVTDLQTDPDPEPDGSLVAHWPGVPWPSQQGLPELTVSATLRRGDEIVAELSLHHTHRLAGAITLKITPRTPDDLATLRAALGDASPEEACTELLLAALGSAQPERMAVARRPGELPLLVPGGAEPSPAVLRDLALQGVRELYLPGQGWHAVPEVPPPLPLAEACRRSAGAVQGWNWVGDIFDTREDAVGSLTVLGGQLGGISIARHPMDAPPERCVVRHLVTLLWALDAAVPYGLHTRRGRDTLSDMTDLIDLDGPAEPEVEFIAATELQDGAPTAVLGAIATTYALMDVQEGRDASTAMSLLITCVSVMRTLRALGVDVRGALEDAWTPGWTVQGPAYLNAPR